MNLCELATVSLYGKRVADTTDAVRDALGFFMKVLDFKPES